MYEFPTNAFNKSSFVRHSRDQKDYTHLTVFTKEMNVSFRVELNVEATP